MYRASRLLELSLLRSTYGAVLSTSTTINTSVCVDLILAITLGDSACGTSCCTSTTADAVVTDLISHFSNPPLKICISA